MDLGLKKMWRTLAEASNPEDFGAIQSPIDELPKGTKVRMTFETPIYLPIAPLADLFGAEGVAKIILNDAGVNIIDVEAKGFYKIIVHGEVSSPVAAIIWAIAIVAAAAAIIFTVIKLEADIPSAFRWGAIAIVAASSAVIVVILGRKRLRRVSNG